ncbi:hypothetical protein CRG98_019091 [Punica granatum]|uniref:TIR domain-containing protein n=1 Tax=Punica granatum TaxID=22663 RepID=A0A2I0JXD5_PUNGR|nr:hypothetical protein CRG98_019091 [Punica granatum]
MEGKSSSDSIWADATSDVDEEQSHKTEKSQLTDELSMGGKTPSDPIWDHATFDVDKEQSHKTKKPRSTPFIRGSNEVVFSYAERQSSKDLASYLSLTLETAGIINYGHDGLIASVEEIYQPIYIPVICEDYLSTPDCLTELRYLLNAWKLKPDNVILPIFHGLKPSDTFKRATTIIEKCCLEPPIREACIEALKEVAKMSGWVVTDPWFNLTELIGELDTFGPGSRIIVTSRYEKHLPRVDQTFEVPELCRWEVQLLFSSYTDADFPPFNELAAEIVSVVGGLPLVVEVIGSVLFGKGVAVWTETLQKLKLIHYKGVQEKLMISYEALDAPQKQMFLDIACSVNGEDLRIASYMWHEFSTSHLSGGSEYRHLLSLVKIGDDNELWMHDELRELGRQLLACQCGDTDFPMEIKPQTTWRDYGMFEGVKEFPSTIVRLERLEEIHASYCRNLTKFIPSDSDNVAFGSLMSLKTLRLGFSRISELPENFRALPRLETLDLLQCNMLRKLPVLPSSITSLRYTCKGMERPRLFWLDNLKEVLLADTDTEKLICRETDSREPTFWPDGGLPTQERNFFNGFSLIGCPKVRIVEFRLPWVTKIYFPISSRLRHSLKKVVLSCVNLQYVPAFPPTLVSLTFQYCWSLKSACVHGLKALEELYLDHSAIIEILDLHELEALVILKLSHCRMEHLKGLQELTSLRSLTVSHCDHLSEFPDLSKLKALVELHLDNSAISQISGLSNLQALEILKKSTGRLKDVHSLMSLCLRIAQQLAPGFLAEAPDSPKLKCE